MKMTTKTKHDERAGTVDLIGGRLCLDFVNSVDSRSAEPVEELLLSYADLVEWGAHAGALTPGEAERMLAAGARRPGAAGDALRQAIVLREALYRVLAAALEDRGATEADLGVVNAALGRAMAHQRLEPGAAGYTWAWEGESGESGDAELDRMLWPVARSAGDLLTSEDLGRVRACASQTCGWLFL